MENNEFEMILYDRIEIIKTVNAKYDIEKNEERTCSQMGKRKP